MRHRLKKKRGGLVGSPWNPPTLPTQPAQKAEPFPLEQLRANHPSVVLVASENLGLKRAPKPQAQVRERNGLTRRDIAVLLAGHPEVAADTVKGKERALLIDLGMGNVTLEQAAARAKTDKITLGILIDAHDRDIILDALWKHIIKPRQGKFISRDLHSYEWGAQHDADLQDREIVGSDSFHVSNPKESIRKPRQSGKPYESKTRTRDSFNTGTLKRVASGSEDPDGTVGDESASDDYGEESAV